MEPLATAAATVSIASGTSTLLQTGTKGKPVLTARPNALNRFSKKKGPVMLTLVEPLVVEISAEVA